MITKDEALGLLRKAVEKTGEPGLAIHIIDETGLDGRYKETKIVIRDQNRRILMGATFLKSFGITDAISSLLADCLTQRIEKNERENDG